MKQREEKKLHLSLRLVAESSVIVFLGIALSKLLTYLYRVVIARELGPEIYGLFSLALVVSSFFVMAASLGLPEGTLRYLSFYRGKGELAKARYLFRFAIKTLLVSSIIAGTILFFCARVIAVNIFHNDSLVIYLRIFGVFLPFSVISGLILSNLLAFGHFGWNAFINNFLQNFIKVIGLFTLLFFGFTSGAVVGSYVFGIVCMCLAALFALRYAAPTLLQPVRLDYAEKRGVLRETFSYSWPIIFLSAVYTLFNWTDSVVIGYVMTAKDVGVYNAAFTLISLFGIAPELFKQFFFPYIVREYSRKNFSMIRQLSQQVGKWIYLLNLPLFLFMIAFPGAVINVLFGPDYLAASDVLRILAVGGLLASFNTLLTNILSMQGKSKLIMIDTLAISALDLLLNVLLVPRYGLYGAAASTSFSLAFLGAIMLFQVRASTGILPFRRKMWHVTLAALVPTTVLAYIQQQYTPSIGVLALAGISFIALYVFLLFAFRSLDLYDWDIIRYVREKLNYFSSRQKKRSP